MKGYKLDRKAESVLSIFLTFLLYHGAACTIVSLFYKEGYMIHYWHFVLLVFSLFFLALVRAMVTNFGIFFLLHVLLPFSGLLMTDIGERMVSIACMVIMAVISVCLRTTEKWKRKESPSLGMGVILLLCYILGYYMQIPALIQLSYYELLAYIVLYFLHENLKNTTDFVYIHKDTANFPVGQMTIINRMLLMLFLVVLAVAMLLVPKLHLEIIFAPLVKGFFLLLSWLFSFIHFSEVSEKMEQTAQGISNEDLLKALGTSETGLFWKIVEQVLVAVVILVLAAAVVGGTAYLLFYLYKKFYAEKKENEDEKEFLTEEIIWFPKKIFSKKEMNQKELGSNQKIRKVYKRYIRKSFKKKEDIPVTLTPKELLLSLEENQVENIRKIYEHARYSEEVCTPKELEEIKELLSGKSPKIE